MFSSKTKIEQANQRISLLDIQHKDILTEQTLKRKALEEHQKKLDFLLEIRRQLQLLHTTQSKAYWLDEKKRLEAIEEKPRKELLQLDADYRASKKLYIDLKPLEYFQQLKELYIGYGRRVDNSEVIGCLKQLMEDILKVQQAVYDRMYK